MKILTVNDVVKSHLCCGCGLCESIAGHDAIEMIMTADGFPVPKVKKAHDKDKEILACCPGVVLKQPRDHRKNLWGPLSLLCEGYSTDSKLRFQCSSGGGISGMLLYLLQSRQADFILQVGVSKHDPLAVEVYCHNNEAIIQWCAGSRYQPSSPLRSIRTTLEGLPPDSTVAVVGKPCDVAALRRYWNFAKDIQKYKLILISFACAGMPSQNATLKLIEDMGMVPEKITSFRYRGEGWPGNVTAQSNDGRREERSYLDSWGKILGGMINFRCKVCPDGLANHADLVFGDAWRTPDGYPDFVDRNGISLCIARTELGVRLLRQAAAAGALKLSPITTQELKLMQPYHFLKKVLFMSRYLALRCFFTGKYPDFKDYLYWFSYVGWRGFPKNFFGTLKRYKRI